MNRYVEMMERMPVPENQAERLKARVLAAEPEKKRRAYRPRSFAKNVLLAAVLVVLLAATAGTAAELVPWDAFFTERFSAGAADSPAAEDVFQNVDVTSVCGDVTLTVRQALGDEKTLYLLLDYQLPENVDMEMVRTVWEDRKGPVGNVELYSGTVKWTDIEGMGSWEASCALAGKNLPFSGSVETVDFDADSRTLTMLVTCAFSDKVSLGKPMTVLAWEPSVKWEGERVDLADHAAVVTFRPSYEARAKEGQKRKDGVTYTVELTPLSIKVENAGDREADLYTMWQLRQKIVLVYQDGTEAPIRDFSPTGSGGRGTSGDRHYESCKLLLKKLVDTAQVRAVRVGDLEIPIS
ncbi:hypothetical protein [Dysosmobacter sp.]|uniref:hypothetical protein n=1 Tax=Dysosmobacter sp. TaxID=2591382 RepID=UPI002A95CE4E|nr:hypothetical protein [Dysosmobacter sp.]MDY5611632.1 hypothetical protein [Dysosmobacter sp.]